MEKFIIHKVKKLSGCLRIPGDKSISHRAVMFGSLACGTTNIRNFLQSEDCLSTLESFRKMGIKIKRKGDKVTVFGKGLYGLKPSKSTLNANNSGTTTRLMLGILAAQPFTSTITGDKSLCKRPMRRVADPLRVMGASVTGKDGGTYAPLTLTGG